MFCGPSMGFTEINIILMRFINGSHYIVFKLGHNKFNSLFVSDQIIGGTFNEISNHRLHGF